MLTHSSEFSNQSSQPEGHGTIRKEPWETLSGHLDLHSVSSRIVSISLSWLYSEPSSGHEIAWPVAPKRWDLLFFGPIKPLSKIAFPDMNSTSWWPVGISAMEYDSVECSVIKFPRFMFFKSVLDCCHIWILGTHCDRLPVSVETIVNFHCALQVPVRFRAGSCPYLWPHCWITIDKFESIQWWVIVFFTSDPGVPPAIIFLVVLVPNACSTNKPDVALKGNSGIPRCFHVAHSLPVSPVSPDPVARMLCYLLEKRQVENIKGLYVLFQSFGEMSELIGVIDRVSIFAQNCVLLKSCDQQLLVQLSCFLETTAWMIIDRLHIISHLLKT